MTRSVLAALAALLIVGCETGTSPDSSSDALGIAEHTVPAGADAALPRLSLAPDGTPLLSWVEPEGDGHLLAYATWADSTWGDARVVGRGRDWFVNWADTPGVVPFDRGRLLMHWLQMHPAGDSPYAYDAAASLFNGKSWTRPALLHDDGRPAEHGFVSVALVPSAGGGSEARVPGLVWLDGRNQSGGDHGGHGGGAMTLRFATLGPDGAPVSEQEVDARVCDCCPTALAATASGAVVAYRDRSEDEIRDIAVVRWVDGEWTDPVIPHADGWRIEGCPVNGPALDAVGDRVALAWFTQAGDQPRVRLTVSEDGGATWGAPTRIDAGTPIGRVTVALLENGDVAVGWLEASGDAANVRFQVRRVPTTGDAAAPLTIAEVPADRASGIPRIVRYGSGVLAAWTAPGASPSLRTATVSL